MGLDPMLSGDQDLERMSSIDQEVEAAEALLGFTSGLAATASHNAATLPGALERSGSGSYGRSGPADNFPRRVSSAPDARPSGAAATAAGSYGSLHAQESHWAPPHKLQKIGSSGSYQPRAAPNQQQQQPSRLQPQQQHTQGSVLDLAESMSQHSGESNPHYSIPQAHHPHHQQPLQTFPRGQQYADVVFGQRLAKRKRPSQPEARRPEGPPAVSPQRGPVRGLPDAEYSYGPFAHMQGAPLRPPPADGRYPPGARPRLDQGGPRMLQPGYNRVEPSSVTTMPMDLDRPTPSGAGFAEPRGSQLSSAPSQRPGTVPYWQRTYMPGVAAGDAPVRGGSDPRDGQQPGGSYGVRYAQPSSMYKQQGTLYSGGSGRGEPRGAGYYPPDAATAVHSYGQGPPPHDGGAPRPRYPLQPAMPPQYQLHPPQPSQQQQLLLQQQQLSGDAGADGYPRDTITAQQLADAPNLSGLSAVQFACRILQAMTPQQGGAADGARPDGVVGLSLDAPPPPKPPTEVVELPDTPETEQPASPTRDVADAPAGADRPTAALADQEAPQASAGGAAAAAADDGATAGDDKAAKNVSPPKPKQQQQQQQMDAAPQLDVLNSYGYNSAQSTRDAFAMRDSLPVASSVTSRSTVGSYGGAPSGAAVAETAAVSTGPPAAVARQQQQQHQQQQWQQPQQLLQEETASVENIQLLIEQLHREGAAASPQGQAAIQHLLHELAAHQAQQQQQAMYHGGPPAFGGPSHPQQHPQYMNPAMQMPPAMSYNNQQQQQHHQQQQGQQQGPGGQGDPTAAIADIVNLLMRLVAQYGSGGPPGQSPPIPCRMMMELQALIAGVQGAGGPGGPPGGIPPWLASMISAGGAPPGMMPPQLGPGPAPGQGPGQAAPLPPHPHMMPPHYPRGGPGGEPPFYRQQQHGPSGPQQPPHAGHAAALMRPHGPYPDVHTHPVMSAAAAAVQQQYHGSAAVGQRQQQQQHSSPRSGSLSPADSGSGGVQGKPLHGKSGSASGLMLSSSSRDPRARSGPLAKSHGSPPRNGAAAIIAQPPGRSTNGGSRMPPMPQHTGRPAVQHGANHSTSPSPLGGSPTGQQPSDAPLGGVALKVGPAPQQLPRLTLSLSSGPLMGLGQRDSFRNRSSGELARMQMSPKHVHISQLVQPQPDAVYDGPLGPPLPSPRSGSLIALARPGGGRAHSLDQGGHIPISQLVSASADAEDDGTSADLDAPPVVRPPAAAMRSALQRLQQTEQHEQLQRRQPHSQQQQQQQQRSSGSPPAVARRSPAADREGTPPDVTTAGGAKELGKPVVGAVRGASGAAPGPAPNAPAGVRLGSGSPPGDGVEAFGGGKVHSQAGSASQTPVSPFEIAVRLAAVQDASDRPAAANGSSTGSGSEERVQKLASELGIRLKDHVQDPSNYPHMDGTAALAQQLGINLQAGPPQQQHKRPLTPASAAQEELRNIRIRMAEAARAEEV